MAQHGVAEAEAAGQLAERLAVALDVHQDVVGLVNLRDRERQLTPAPILEAMHGAVAGRDHALVALQHGWNLLTLVGMDQENDLVMSHCCSSWICLPSARICGEARSYHRAAAQQGAHSSGRRGQSPESG